MDIASFHYNKEVVDRLWAESAAGPLGQGSSFDPNQRSLDRATHLYLSLYFLVG